MAIEKSMLATGLIGDAANLYFSINDFKNAKKEGNSTPVAMAKAVGSFAWGEFYYGALSSVIGNAVSKMGIKGLGGFGLTMLGTAAITMGQAGVSLAGTAFEHTTRTMNKSYSQKGKLGSGYFNMNEVGYTMRQRSLNAIRSNGLNTQSVLGNEARTYFRSYS